LNICARIQDVVYGIAETADIEEMADLLANVFSRFEPPAVASGLSFDEVREIVLQYGWRAPADGLTLLARDQPSGRLIGAMLTDDFATPPPVPPDRLPKKFMPIAALLDELDRQYREHHSVVQGDALHLFMLGVAPDFGGKGIANGLVRLTLDNGKQKGFSRAITEATGNVSQHVFHKQGFVGRFRIAYPDFRFEGRRTFETIVEHQAVLLMERRLDT
jgi:GNAT superfamily N-acetyltransferase